MNAARFRRAFAITFTFTCAIMFPASARAASCGLDSWTPRPTITGLWLREVAFGAGRFVAAGDQGVMLSSPDGASPWQPQWYSPNIDFVNVTFANGQFFATGRKLGALFDGWEAVLWSSPNGLTWNPRYNTTNTLVTGVAYGAGRFVALAIDAAPEHVTRALTSPDGAQWTDASMPGNGSLYDLAFGNGAFVAVGGGRIVRSSDGLTWLAGTSPVTASLLAVEFFNGSFVAVGTGGTILTSTDGVNWTPRVSGTTELLTTVAAGGGIVAAAGGNGLILTSRDGVSWMPVFEGASDFYGLAFGADTLVAVGRYGTVYQSGPLSACGGPSLGIRFGSPTQIALSGDVGASYRVEFSNGLEGSGGWQLLETIPALPMSPYTVTDPTPSPTGRRFYRAVQLP